MKKALLLGMLALSSLVGVGCNSPAYTADERHAMILRNWDYEGKQATEDFAVYGMYDRASHLTPWHVR